MNSIRIEGEQVFGTSEVEVEGRFWYVFTLDRRRHLKLIVDPHLSTPSLHTGHQRNRRTAAHV